MLDESAKTGMCVKYQDGNWVLSVFPVKLHMGLI